MHNQSQRGNDTMLGAHLVFSPSEGNIFLERIKALE